MAEHGAALAIDAVNRMGVQVDNIDIQVDRELSAEGLGRMITSSHNGVVRGFFYRFATGRKRPGAVIQGEQIRPDTVSLYASSEAHWTLLTL
jgi:hypothetical protein